MARTRFQHIRAALKFYANGDESIDKIRDPLWHSRSILGHFQKRFAAFATPTGVSTIDEMTVATKLARERALRRSLLCGGRLGLAVRAFSMGQRIGQHAAIDASPALHRPVSGTAYVPSQYAGASRPVNLPQHSGSAWWDINLRFCALLADIDSLFPTTSTHGTPLLRQFVLSPTVKCIPSAPCV
eukprot:jgi/Phyca11/111707/e_gw1.20.416.1